MTYFVSRQCYWPEGREVVEIASGGLDYANPDMLSPQFRREGEGQEYQDPREAVEAALAVRKAWAQSQGKDIRAFRIAHGATGGFTLPFDPCTVKEALHWAETVYQGLPKCAECGEILGKEKYTHDYACDGESFCREYCAEKNYGRQVEEEDLYEEP